MGPGWGCWAPWGRVGHVEPCGRAEVVLGEHGVAEGAEGLRRATEAEPDLEPPREPCRVRRPTVVDLALEIEREVDEVAVAARQRLGEAAVDVLVHVAHVPLAVLLHHAGFGFGFGFACSMT